MTRFESDPSIPVLTEVIELNEEAARKMAGPLGEISTELPQSAPDDSNDEDQEQERQTMDQAAIDALELRIREQVLRTLTPRVEELIETRLRGRLNELVDHVLIGMGAQIKDSIRETLHDAVSRAVSDELLMALLDRAQRDTQADD